MTSVDGLEVMRRVAVGAVDPGVVELESRLRVAQLTADVAALDSLISDELLFAGPDGRLASKEEDLAAHRSGGVRFVRHEPIQLRMRPVSTAVVVTSLATDLVVDVGGVRDAGTFRYTRVWAREDDGAWRVVAGHVSEVASEG